MRPVPDQYPISLGFGVKDSGDVHHLAGYHTGIDYACPLNTPVRAPHKGVVVSSTYDSGYGNSIVIEGGTTQGLRRWRLAHLNSKNVTVGQGVTTETVIGLSGATGNVTGPHVHAEQLHSPFGYWDHEKPFVLERPYRP